MPTVMMCGVATVGGVKASAIVFPSPSVTGLKGFTLFGWLPYQQELCQ
jgi:hypothetical protein